MPQAILVRPPTPAERQALEAGLRSPSPFVLRRCQARLASARGERVPQIARALGCDPPTVRNAIHALNETGLAALEAGSSRPHTIQAAVDPEGTERLRALLHQSPRPFGKPTSLWTLDLAAAVCPELGITDRLVTGETIRATLVRRGMRWLRAKEWLRFVAGRPVSGITTQFLDWCCQELAAAGKKALLRVWDNASWQISQEVRGWIRAHNRPVKREGKGVRIVGCGRPTKSPWLNAIEPNWVPGKRRVVEAERLLTAWELIERVCAAYGCRHEPHLSLPEKVA